jgi:hypothetical protein
LRLYDGTPLIADKCAIETEVPNAASNFI